MCEDELLIKVTGTLYYICKGEDKTPIAYALRTPDNNIRAVMVDKEYRQKGYGKRLVNEIVKDIQADTKAEDKESEIGYYCHPKNKASNELARSCGFRRWNYWFKGKEQDA